MRIAYEKLLLGGVSQICVAGNSKRLQSDARHCYCDGMTPRRTDLKALRNMIAKAQKILSTTSPECRSERACELLTSAVSLADHLLSVSPAAALGKKGGLTTAQRGSDYFRQLAAKRKHHGGGRPPIGTVK